MVRQPAPPARGQSNREKDRGSTGVSGQFLDTPPLVSLTETFRVLRDLQHEIAEQQSQLRIKNFWNSIDQVGDLKKLEDKVHTALEEIQVSKAFHVVRCND